MKGEKGTGRLWRWLASGCQLATVVMMVAVSVNLESFGRPREEHAPVEWVHASAVAWH